MRPHKLPGGLPHKVSFRISAQDREHLKDLLDSGKSSEWFRCLIYSKPLPKMGHHDKYEVLHNFYVLNNAVLAINELASKFDNSEETGSLVLSRLNDILELLKTELL